MHRSPHHWLGHPQLLNESISTKSRTAIFTIKEVSYERADAARVRGRAKGKQQEREVESWLKKKNGRIR